MGSMGLQFVFGNPISKKKRRAKLNQSSKMRPKAKAAKKSMKRKKIGKKHHAYSAGKKIKHKKNPAYIITSKEGVKSSVFFPAKKQIARIDKIAEKFQKQAKEHKEKAKTLISKASKAEGAEKQQLLSQAKAHTATQKRVTHVIGQIKGQVKKMKSVVEGAKYEALQGSRAGAKVHLQARVKEVDKKVDDMIKSLSPAKKAGVSRSGSEDYVSRHRGKKGAKVAKKKKHKAKKKHAAKKHKAKKHAAKKPVAVKHKAKKHKAKKHKAKKRVKLTANHALKIVKRFKKAKKGAKRTLKVGKRKQIWKRVNPEGGSSMASKVEKALGHTAMEAGGLAVGGAVVAGLNGLIARLVPSIAAMTAKIPVVGSALAPLAVGVALNQVKNEYAQAIGKGIVGATVVKMAMETTTKVTGLGAIMLFPAGGPMGNIKMFPGQDVDSDFNGLAVQAKASDFGAEDIDYKADFNGVAERALAGQHTTQDSDDDEDSMG